jgi:hypothetical protein
MIVRRKEDEAGDGWKLPKDNYDGFVKSPIAGHCEERSDEAIP